jgi:hypothetical protein
VPWGGIDLSKRCAVELFPQPPRKRFGNGFATHFVHTQPCFYCQVLVKLPVEPRELTFMIALARNENLGIYDASYLAIALEHDCALASRDGRLLEAAIHQNIDVIDLR